MAEDHGTSSKTSFDRQLADNCVEYYLLVIDDEADHRHQLSGLEAVRKAALQISQSLTRNYIWQRDEFNLELKSENGLTYLYGITDYGDAVEDEWLIVYMLRELSRSRPNLWVRVCDTDGEFLLIEAANVLPRWLSPETDQNRVWVHQGTLKIIPAKQDHIPSQPRHLTLLEAIHFLRSNRDALVHSPLVEEEAFYRLGKYPAYVDDSIHHSLVTVPRKVAHVLHTLPKSVSPAVEAFYLRDPLAIKPIMSPSGPLTFPPQDLVTMSVRFSKVLFAQLRSQRFDPPPRWQAVLQQARETSVSSEEDSRRLSRLEIGMMLTCGFEMLAATAEKSKSRVVREVAIILSDLEEDGEEALPSNEQIRSWADSTRDDNEAWMDINFEDFEQELEGKRVRASADRKGGFGDAQAQDDLRKIVSRFESFLNDETAGLDGAELDDMDVDDDEDDDSDDESEDKEVSFDEQEFSRMMREMMGMPPTDTTTPVREKLEAAADPSKQVEELPTEDDEIQKLSSQMEAELNEHGALKLDGANDGRPRIKDKGKGVEKVTPSDSRHIEDDDDSDEGEIDIDYNLAKNLLESFKSQGGMAGPTGNILGMMGIQLPRDEDDGTEVNSQDKTRPSRP